MPKDKDKKKMKKLGKALLVSTSPAGKLPAMTKKARKKLTEKKKKELLENEDKALQDYYEKKIKEQEKEQRERDVEKEQPRLGNNPEGYKNGGKVKKVKRDPFNGPKAKRNKKTKKKLKV